MSNLKLTIAFLSNVLTLVLWAAWFGAGPAVHAQSLPTVYDGRADSRATKPSAAEEQLVRRYSLPKARQFWRSDRFCTESFETVDVARGAFTRPNVDQRAVLYRYCLLGHDIAKDGIAILEGGKVIGNILFDGGEDSSPGSLPDIDGDGMSEMVLSDGSVHQGFAESAAIVIQVASSEIKRLGVAEVFSDNCGAMVKGCRSIVYRVSVKPGRSPVFFRETFTNKREHWIKTGNVARYHLQKDEASYRFIN